MDDPIFTILERRTINIETRAWTYSEGFIYIEIWHNNRLKDNYFCYAGDVYPNGQPRPNVTKFFYSSASGSDIEKQLIPLRRPSQFKYFDKLYYINEDGEIVRIDGIPAEECDYTLVLTDEND